MHPNTRFSLLLVPLDLCACSVSFFSLLVILAAWSPWPFQRVSFTTPYSRENNRGAEEACHDSGTCDHSRVLHGHSWHRPSIHGHHGQGPAQAPLGFLAPDMMQVWIYGLQLHSQPNSARLCMVTQCVKSLGPRWWYLDLFFLDIQIWIIIIFELIIQVFGLISEPKFRYQEEF